MRILHVNKFLFRKGGAEGYMEDLAALQEAEGHEVAFWGMEHPENTHLDLRDTFAPPLDFDRPPSGLAARARMVERMVWSRPAAEGIAQAVRRVRPDVAHLHNVYHQLSPSILGPLTDAGVPVVMTLHDYKLVCPTYQLLDHGRPCTACVGNKFWHAPARRCRDGSLLASGSMALELAIHTATRAYRGVNAFVCPSRFLAGQMRAGRVYPDRLHVIPHFVDLRGLETKASRGGAAVVAGRLAPEKGIDVAIRAIARLPGPAHLHVAGDGPSRAELEQLAASVAPGRVTFHGRLPKDALLDLVRSSSVAVVPSVWFENQPMAVLEAQAVGVPVVASDLGGLPELIQPGVNGELVPPGDEARLAAAIGALLGDPVRAFEMGRAAHRQVAAELSPERHLERIHGLYRRIGASSEMVGSAT